MAAKCEQGFHQLGIVGTGVDHFDFHLAQVLVARSVECHIGPCTEIL